MPDYEGMKFCGLPDDVQGTRVGDLCKWTKKLPLTWLLAEDWPVFSGEDLARAFRIAFERWEAVANLKFAQVAQGPADITIYPRKLDGAAGVLAESQLPCGTTDYALWQRYDTGENWIISDNPPSGAIDLIRVACHEIGHALGIGHIAGPNLMAPHYSTKIRDPQVGDRSEIVARYGVKPQEPSEPPKPPSGSSDYVLMKFPKDWLVVPEE